MSTRFKALVVGLGIGSMLSPAGAETTWNESMFVEPSKRPARAARPAADPGEGFDSMGWLERALQAEDVRAEAASRSRPARASYEAAEVPGSQLDATLGATVAQRTSRPRSAPAATEERAPARPMSAPLPQKRAPEPKSWIAPPGPRAQVEPVAPIEMHPLRALQGRYHYRHLQPTLGGATGLLDVPVAATTPCSEWVLSYSHARFDADSTWWPLPYKRLQSSTNTVHASYGLSHRVEAQASFELWNRELAYLDPINGTDPIFVTEGKLFTGVGAKMVTPDGHFFGMPFGLAAGFRFQLREPGDRDITELHEYERFSNVYAVASMRPTEDVFVHAMLKYVIYDFDGDRPPSGATAAFIGFSIPPTWLQPGLAAEWWFRPDFSVYGELVEDTDIDWQGGLSHTAFNAGLRYQGRRIGGGIFAKRLNHHGMDYYGVQASLRLP